MAERKNEGEVVRNDPAQVKPTADRSNAELKAQVVAKDDVDLGALKEPEHLQDQTSAPTEFAPAERPPVATQRFDEPVLQSLVKGAGAHEPPDPEKFDAEGRLRD